MKIAIIAHDKKKQEMIEFCKRHVNVLKRHQLFATGTTGKVVMEETGLIIHCHKSGPLGGDQEIGARVANGDLDIIIFFIPFHKSIQSFFNRSAWTKINIFL